MGITGRDNFDESMYHPLPNDLAGGDQHISTGGETTIQSVGYSGRSNQVVP